MSSPFRRPRRRQDRSRPRHDPISRQRRRARGSKPTFTLAQAYDLAAVFRWFMRISTASAIPLSWKRSACRHCPSHGGADRMAERAPEALPRTESHRRSSGAGIDGPRRLKSPAMEKRRSSRKAQGAAAVSHRGGLCRRNPPAHVGDRRRVPMRGWSATMAFVILD